MKHLFGLFPFFIKLIIGFVITGFFYAVPLAAEPLRMVNDVDGNGKYAKGLLRLALSKIDDKFEWDDSIPSATEGRTVEMLQLGELDLIWYATTSEYEEKMTPIRIPLFRGLLGYRVFMMKTGNQYKFDGIKTLSDLKRISIGQGRSWADTFVLEANGLDVVKVTKYFGLFYMLDGDRFDAFPRGVHEPWYEIPRYPNLQLDVEKNLMLSYTSPLYFFVNKNNKELAAKIEKGLRIAIADGSFEKYFLNDPLVKDVLLKANIKNRTIIKLKNPSLPPLTPVNDPDLWFDPSQH